MKTMKKFWSVMLTVLFAFSLFACGQSPNSNENGVAKSGQVAEKVPEPQPAIASVVENFTWERYSSEKNQAWSRYDAEKMAAWSIYDGFQEGELVKFRQRDKENYYEWLDAEKRGDYRRKNEIEQTVPAAVDYNRKTNEKYKEYKKTEEAAYKKFKAADDAAYKKYLASKKAQQNLN
jgi:hypothetical protein